MDWASLDRRLLRALAVVVRALQPALIPSRTCAMTFIQATGGDGVRCLPNAISHEMAEHAQHEREGHPRARIVLALSLACTLLAIYDLILLASGG